MEVLRVLSGSSATLGVERLWSHARAVLTDDCRSMLMKRMIQPLLVKMNGMLLEEEDLRGCAKTATLHDEGSFEGIFDDLQQFEEEELAECAEQEGADVLGDLLGDAEGSVASDDRTEAAMPIIDHFAIWRGRTAVPRNQMRCLYVAISP
jgi:hypothetical protein